MYKRKGVDGPQDFPLPNTNLINVYNALSAVALLCEFGLPKAVSYTHLWVPSEPAAQLLNRE